MLKYYIDESGHSGDLVASTGENFDFDGQPYFTLAAVGVADLRRLEGEVSSLRGKHRIAPGELKSKSLQSKSAFIADLLNLLISEKCQLFVEIVDKRYFLCTQIVNIILLHAAPVFGSAEAVWEWQNSAADWLYDRISEHVLNRFVETCSAPSDHTLMSALGSLVLIAARHLPEEEEDFGDLMQDLIVDTIKAYGKLREQNTTAYLDFLPVPDDSKSARKIWVLPNFSCLTNLYARINRYHERRLNGIRLVHDHQLQLDEILKSAKRSAETVGDGAFTPHSDYNFTETATLEFCGSDRNLGIQCADVLAGTVMRYFRDRLKGVGINDEIELVMRTLLGGTDTRNSFGINQVVPSKMVLYGS
jgi:hypothetical protein